MNEYEKAARSHRMWFGSYTRAGELKKTQVWCFLNNGKIEFLTGGDSYKVKRVRRNPRVICCLGSENGPVIEGNAELISDPTEVWLDYQTYWKIHPWMMLLFWRPIRRRVQSGHQILVRVKPDEPNPFTGLTRPAS